LSACYLVQSVSFISYEHRSLFVAYTSAEQRLFAGATARCSQCALSYKRIAGYFTSSLFEVADELLVKIPLVQIVCNTDVHTQDWVIARQRESRMLRHWNETNGNEAQLVKGKRYQRLDDFLGRHGQNQTGLW
jgi:hypothetical protein